MGERSIKHALLRISASDLPLTSRVLGVFYLSGALLVLLSLLLPHPLGAREAGLLAIAGAAAAVGTGSIVMAKHARIWTVHAVLGSGTGLICLCLLFAGVATPIYAAMFVWVVLVAASFFTGRSLAAHVIWVLLSSGLTLLALDEPSDFSLTTRWVLGALVLVVAAAVMSELVAGRRSTEEQLRIEIEKRERLQRELERLAHSDSLTGIANRRHFDHELPREMARAARQGLPLCLVTLDIDDFKRYNDEYGHAAGDRLLKSAVSGWATTLRAEDMLARLGGDEFVAMLPNCPSAEAERVAERLCRGVAAAWTCSAGTACWDGRENAEQLLERADRAMYKSKSSRPARGADRSSRSR